MVDKVDTSSAEAPMAHALVGWSSNKALDDAPIDDDPDFLNFAVAVPWNGCWMSFLLQKYWPDPRKLDDLVIVTPDAGLAISVFSHEDVKGGFWTRSWLASLILLPSASFWIFFGLIILGSKF
jgi:hypothetical protein